MKRKQLSNYILHLLLIITSLSMILPIIWMFVSSFKEVSEITRIPPTFLPEKFTLDSWKAAFEFLPLWRLLFNSFIVTSLVVIGQTFTSAIIGFVFAKYEFLFKEKIFMLILTRMMTPIFAFVIPLYWLITRFGWLDSFKALIIPWIISSYGIFMMRQFIEGIPNELMDSARIDGCSEFQIFFKIILPNSKSAIATLAILVFTWEWNQFIWPLLVIMSTKMQTLPLGLSKLLGQQYARYDVAMPAATFATIPIIIFYLFFQKYITQGITFTGLKE